jgi:hypothetical protein
MVAREPTRDQLCKEILNGTYCACCGSDSETIMRIDLEHDKVLRWQQAVNACDWFEDPEKAVLALVKEVLAWRRWSITRTGSAKKVDEAIAETDKHVEFRQ